MVLVWSGLLRTRSPWLMSLVQVAPLLALPANGLLSLAACGVHEPLRLNRPVTSMSLNQRPVGVDRAAATGFRCNHGMPHASSLNDLIGRYLPRATEACPIF